MNTKIAFSLNECAIIYKQTLVSLKKKKAELKYKMLAKGEIKDYEFIILTSTCTIQHNITCIFSLQVRDFTNNPRDIINFLEDIEETFPCETFDLSSLFDVM